MLARVWRDTLVSGTNTRVYVLYAPDVIPIAVILRPAYVVYGKCSSRGGHAGAVHVVRKKHRKQSSRELRKPIDVEAHTIYKRPGDTVYLRAFRK